MGHAPKRIRKDIQGLRAVAIFGVLLFHLAPKRFLNGFLGVDVFFVLSGYLMSSILSRESTINLGVIKTFYIRRFKRIVPLYAIMLAALAVVTPLIFIPTDMPHFLTDMQWALPFAENMQIVMKKYDYWSEVFNSPVLLHAWSLGVEIQYYLIVPFIMKAAEFGNSDFKIALFLGLSGVSYFFHFFSAPTTSFGSLFARVWQFLTGSIIFEFEEVLDETPYQLVDQEKLLDEDEDDLESGGADVQFAPFEVVDPLPKVRQSRWSSWRVSVSPFIAILSYCVSFYLLWMVIMSSSGATISRFFVTLAAGVLLLLGKYSENKIISNRIMAYIGDLSYLIYLVHWPVIILYKYYHDETELLESDMYICALTTLVISILLHHSVENFFIASSTTVSVALVGVLYAAIVLALLTNGMQHLSKISHVISPEEAEAIRYNQEQSRIVFFSNPVGCVRDLEAEKWTAFTEEEQLRCVSTGHGTANVLVMGNSYGYRAFPVLHRLFAGRYAKMRMFTKSARTYLTRDLNSTTFPEKEKILVAKMQPDIVFVIEKDSYELLMKPIVGKVENDPVTKYLQTSVDYLSNNSGTVIIDQQYYKPHPENGVAYMIQRRLVQGRSYLDDLKTTRKEYEAEFATEINRTATIKNKNVIVNQVQYQLCPGQYCYFFNRDNLHAYYGDFSGHMTSEGLKLLEPGYSKIIEDFLSWRLPWRNATSTAPLWHD